jgi:hypothetical protein
MSKNPISELFTAVKEKDGSSNKYDIALGSSVAKPIPEPYL